MMEVLVIAKVVWAMLKKKLDGEPKLFSFEGPASGWDGNVSSMSVAHCVAASLAQTEHRRQW